MTKILLFEILPNQIWRYKTLEYEIINDFYIFVDLKDNKTYKYHTTLYRGETEVKE